MNLDALSAPVRYSATLEAAIQEVLPATDEFDDADFDPTEHINKMFPTEESLSGVEPYMQELGETMASLDEEILQTVRQQTSAGSAARKDLEAGKQSIQELFIKVRDIKSKADASEQMVQDICRDIKSLDYAKRHLTQTITALKRLQMLVTAVEQLDVMARERMYSEAANLLQAVNQLLEHFANYKDIQKIDDLRDQITTIKTALRTQVFDDFNTLSADNSTVAPQHAQFETLTGACAVVDALGPECRKEMIAWFSGWQFAPYKHTFQPYGEAGTLAKTELRQATCARCCCCCCCGGGGGSGGGGGFCFASARADNAMAAAAVVYAAVAAGATAAVAALHPLSPLVARADAAPRIAKRACALRSLAAASPLSAPPSVLSPLLSTGDTERSPAHVRTAPSSRPQICVAPAAASHIRHVVRQPLPSVVARRARADCGLLRHLAEAPRGDLGPVARRARCLRPHARTPQDDGV